MTTIAATVWSPSDGNGEWSGSSSVDIADNSGNLLVDSSSNFIVDDDSTFTAVPASTWSSNDGS